MSTFQSWNDVSDFIKGLLIPGKTGNTNVERLRSAFLAITAQMAAGGVDPEVDALWNETTVYPKDTQPVLWRDRWLVSNITANEGIEPVTADGVVNPTWRLIGSSSGAGIRPWTAIVYPNILEMVFVDGALYYLDRDVVGVNPYLSADFAAELVAGDWKVMVGSSGAGAGLTLEGGNLKLGDGNSIDFVPRTGTNNDAVLYLRGELSGISTSTVDGAYTTYYVREGESQILNVGDTTNTLLYSFARDLEAETFIDQEAYPAGGGSRYTSVHEVVRDMDSFVEIIGRSNMGSGNKLHKLQLGYVNGVWKASFEDATDSPKGLEYAGDYSATLGANSLITKAIAEALVNALKGAVPTEGDTLEKLYNLLTSGYVTLATEQEITGLKKFPANGYRFLPDGGLGRKEVIMRSVSNSGAETVQNVPVFYFNSNYDIAMTKGSLDGSGWKFVMNPTAFRAWTWKDEDGTVAFLADIAPAKIVEYLTSITVEEEKLPASAVQSSPYNPDHFEYDPVTGAFQVVTNSVPAPGAKGFMTAEDFHAYEEANPRGSNFWDLSNLREARYTMDFTGRKGVVTGSSIIIIGSGGSSGNKGVVSFDLRHFTEFTTGWFDNYAIETAKGTTIIAGRDAGGGTYMCKRSTDDGRNWTNITLPADSLPYDIASDGDGNWVIACRTTTAAAPNVLYSSDDGLTWAAGTVSDETLEYMGVICVDGQFLVYASLGTDKYQHSTNGGQTFASATATGDSGHFPAFGIAHKGDMYISSNASGSHNRLLRSTDKGATLAGLSNGFDDVAIKSIASVGDYLYVASQGDGRLFRSKTGDTGDWEELTTGLANEITFITGGILHDTPIVIIGTGTAGERILINI